MYRDGRDSKVSYEVGNSRNIERRPHLAGCETRNGPVDIETKNREIDLNTRTKKNEASGQMEYCSD